MSVDRILLDNSCGIEYFRNKSSSVAQKVDRVLEEDEVYDQKDANGFIKLNALRFIIEVKASRK